jgi:hypothetical protein
MNIANQPTEGLRDHTATAVISNPGHVTKINYWAVILAAFAAFVMSSLYYSPLLLATFGVASTRLQPQV